MRTTGAEWTKAVTDLINGLVTLWPVIWFLCRKPFTKRYKLWAAAFALLALVSIAGFFMHGFVMSDFLTDALWCGLYVLLSLMLCAYVCAVKVDLDGERGFGRFSRFCLTEALAVSALICAAIIIFSENIFPLFSLYCLSGMAWCIVRLFGQLRARPAFGWYLAGLFVFLAGSILQSVRSIRFTLIWEFDHDAVYHWMVLLFMLLQFKGIRRIGGEK